MRTWLLITLQRYGGWKEYLGYEKGMVILYPFKMKWYKKKKPCFSSMRSKAYDICYKFISRGWVYTRMSFYLFAFILLEETFKSIGIF